MNTCDLMNLHFASFHYLFVFSFLQKEDDMKFQCSEVKAKMLVMVGKDEILFDPGAAALVNCIIKAAESACADNNADGFHKVVDKSILMLRISASGRPTRNEKYVYFPDLVKALGGEIEI